MTENELILNHLDQDYRKRENYKINKVGLLPKPLTIETKIIIIIHKISGD
jgi:hypothetical protein